jgi:DNA-binding NtrC family response regulator
MTQSVTDSNPDAARNDERTSPAIRTRHCEAVFWASSSMREVEADVASALECNFNVMITGEHGVGKRSIARRLHRRGRRAAGRSVIARSPGALDSVESLASGLADAMPDGVVQVEDAERMSPAIQARVLEFLERQTVGRAARTSVRFITVSNANLFDLARHDEFSDALFYRLNAIHLIIPPLRDRQEDIPVLLRHFMSLPAYASLPCLSRAAWQRIVTYEWPGNVRELQGVAEALRSRGLGRFLDVGDLPPELRPGDH